MYLRASPNVLLAQLPWEFIENVRSAVHRYECPCIYHLHIFLSLTNLNIQAILNPLVLVCSLRDAFLYTLSRKANSLRITKLSSFSRIIAL